MLGRHPWAAVPESQRWPAMRLGGLLGGGSDGSGGSLRAWSQLPWRPQLTNMPAPPPPPPTVAFFLSLLSCRQLACAAVGSLGYPRSVLSLSDTTSACIPQMCELGFKTPGGKVYRLDPPAAHSSRHQRLAARKLPLAALAAPTATHTTSAHSPQHARRTPTCSALAHTSRPAPTCHQRGICRLPLAALRLRRHRHAARALPPAAQQPRAAALEAPYLSGSAR